MDVTIDYTVHKHILSTYVPATLNDLLHWSRIILKTNYLQLIQSIYQTVFTYDT